MASRKSLRARPAWVAATVSMLVLSGVILTGLPASAEQPSTIWADSTVPATPADSEASSVEVGTEFTASVNGTITAVEFYKSPQNTGTHIAHVWGPDGKLLATQTFNSETVSGWQRLQLTQPVAVVAGAKYVVSYRAPSGRYAGDADYFANGRTVTSGRLTALRGVYAYDGSRPSNSWRSSNYYVDVQFAPASATSPTTASSATATTTRPTTTSPTTTTTRPTTTSPTTTRPTTTSPTSTSPGTTANPLSSLPRIPWEGGPAYWKQFPNADAGGWDDPSFFPIVEWHGGIMSNAEAQYDKSAGFNTYIGMWEGTPFSLFKDNGMYWIGGKLNSGFDATSGNWVGNFLDDEVDGRYTPAAGRDYLQSLMNSYAGNGKFDYANFTQMVVGTDLGASDAQAFVNNYTDAVSVDMYWYTIPYCSWTPYRGNLYLVPIQQSNCRTASSYGKVMEALRMRDASDGKLQAPWQFIELLNGGPGGGPFTANITPAQLKGAVMSSVINEARGIVYFNQSLSGPCQSANIIRQSQVTPGFCGNAQVAAAKEVNNQIHTLAPVINTQSYQWSFGTGLDTMLKTSDGYAYVFAMVDGSTSPGGRTLQLPSGVSGRTAEVMFENRSVSVDASGRFSDSFAAESVYHIYRIKI